VVERAMGEQDWENAGARWQGNGGRLRLEGSSRYCRIVILRQRIERELALKSIAARLCRDRRSSRGF
jgi:hypothetical protein